MVFLNRNVQTTIGRVFVTLLLSMVLAACGGGGGGSGNDDGEDDGSQVEDGGTDDGGSDSDDDGSDDGSDGSEDLSAEQKAAFAAANADKVATFAEEFVRDEVADPAEKSSCDSGSIRYEENPDELDIEDISFPGSHFQDAIPWPQGDDNNALVRADDCEYSGDSFTSRNNGSANALMRDNIDGQQGHFALVNRIGGYDGDFEDPDLTNDSDPYERDYSSDDKDLNWRIKQGEIFGCAGCVQYDLMDFTGDPKKDTSFAIDLDMTISDSQKEVSVNLDPDPTLSATHFWLYTQEVDAGRTEVTAQGIVEISGTHQDACDIKAEVQPLGSEGPLRIDNYGTDQRTIEDGFVETKLDGETYDVEFHSDGNATVNNDKEIDMDAVKDLCVPPNELDFELSS